MHSVASVETPGLMLFPLLCQQGEAKKALEVLQRRNVPVDLVVHNSVLSMIWFLTSKFSCYFYLIKFAYLFSFSINLPQI